MLAGGMGGRAFLAEGTGPSLRVNNVSWVFKARRWKEFLQGVRGGGERRPRNASWDALVFQSQETRRIQQRRLRGQLGRQDGNQRSVLSRKLHGFPGESSCHLCGIAADGLRKVRPTGGAFVFIKV